MFIFNSSNRVDRFFESAMLIKFYDDTEQLQLAKLKPSNKKYFKNEKVYESNVKFFDNVYDYINEYTSTSNVSLANYENIFLFFFLFCILILFVFVCHCLIVYLYPVFVLFRFIIVRLLYLEKK